jgi:hypothetical protein
MVGLWLAALVGLAAVVHAASDSREQREGIAAQVQEMKLQRLSTEAHLRANMARQSPQDIPIGANGKVAGDGEVLAGWKVAPRWLNIGSTPARALSSRFELRLFDVREQRPIQASDCPTSLSDEPTPPTIVQSGSGMAELAKDLSLADAMAAKDEKKYILMWAASSSGTSFPTRRFASMTGA